MLRFDALDPCRGSLVGRGLRGLVERAADQPVRGRFGEVERVEDCSLRGPIGHKDLDLDRTALGDSIGTAIQNWNKENSRLYTLR